MDILNIKDLDVKTETNEMVLHDLSLSIQKGTIVYLLGPNGSGKSTLSKAIMGFENFKISGGSIYFENLDISNLELSQRARLGIFLAFQNPVEIPGVSYRNFLRLAYNNIHSKGQQISVMTFRKLLLEKSKMFNISQELLDKNLNENLSGGEKKKMEVLQMAILEPKLAILDEVDSGLDIDATKEVYKGLLQYIKFNPNTTLIIITHSLTPFSYLKPDNIFIMRKGQITRMGKQELVEEITKNGFNGL